MFLKIFYTANIILNGENLEATPLKSGVRQDCPLSPLIFSIVFEALVRAIRQEKEITRMQIGEVKLFLPADDMIWYIRYPKTSRHNDYFFYHSGWIQNQFIKLAVFLYTNSKHAEKEIMKTFPFIISF